MAREGGPVWLLSRDMPQSDIDLHVDGRAARRTVFDRTNPAPFGAGAMLRLEPDIGLVSLFAPSAAVSLPLPGLIEEGSALLLRPADGALVVTRGSRRAIVGGREAILLTELAGIGLLPVQISRLDCLVMPADAIGERACGHAAELRVFGAGNDALQMLGSYGAALLRGMAPVRTPELCDLARQFMCGLVNIMSPESAPPGQPRHRPDDRMSAIKSDIEARLTERGLGARQIADRHGISLRYLQKLFEDEQTTFSEFVLQRRLDRALRLLQSAEAFETSISEIAFGVGFGDLSYFNRSFRRRFGAAPREIRTSQRAIVSAQA
ncbi:helix-turn-helix transcriptional regulator [Bosea sp. BK604]|uniref:helix-turn-helix transcriptional regulator n=1 Tax=Bosea sp. BK604 TaxID=2512180 RepID=UPI00104A60A3|nr:helix-turn-helix transcriptional regulator [Bosea sp. BK604]TCR70311.1 AraC-like DNA-binding protein [Bosea sp. BK604]